MRIAVISDVHSNLQALEATLAQIERWHPDQIWCLGDLVGYGADPNACTTLVAEHVDLCLAGNHDLVVRGDIDVEQFSSTAGIAARWTKQQIDKTTQNFLAQLEPQGKRAEIGLYHASPRDPIWEYILSTDQAMSCLDMQNHRICLIGHSHVACHFSRTIGHVDGAFAPADSEFDISAGEWLINPGSVGQPRDGDPRASYLELDTEQGRISFRRVQYPIDSAAQAILGAGLPRQLAKRLYLGQ